MSRWLEFTLLVVVATASIAIPAWVVISGFDKMMDWFVKR